MAYLESVEKGRDSDRQPFWSSDAIINQSSVHRTWILKTTLSIFVRNFQGRARGPMQRNTAMNDPVRSLFRRRACMFFLIRTKRASIRHCVLTACIVHCTCTVDSIRRRSREPQSADDSTLNMPCWNSRACLVFSITSLPLAVRCTHGTGSLGHLSRPGHPFTGSSFWPGVRPEFFRFSKKAQDKDIYFWWKSVQPSLKYWYLINDLQSFTFQKRANAKQR